jgi:hypothetical protein
LLLRNATAMVWMPTDSTAGSMVIVMVILLAGY